MHRWCEELAASSPAPGRLSMLTLDLYNNTALAGTPRSTPTSDLAVEIADRHTTSEL